jgi:hypothetical protein
MNLLRPAPNSPHALCRAVVIALVADNDIDERELDLLSRLDAYGRLGVPPAVLRAMAADEVHRLQGRFSDKPWLSLRDTEWLDEVLAGVTDPARRLLVVRLVAGVITADGTVRDAERLVYEHMLMRWRMSRADVASAIRADPVPSAAMPVAA